MNILCEMFNVYEDNLFYLKHNKNDNENEYKNIRFYIHGKDLLDEGGNNRHDVLLKMYEGKYILNRNRR